MKTFFKLIMTVTKQSKEPPKLTLKGSTNFLEFSRKNILYAVFLSKYFLIALLCTYIFIRLLKSQTFSRIIFLKILYLP